MSAQRASRSRGPVDPPIAIVPDEGSRSPAIAESRVDFPQPLGPTIPTRWCVKF